MGKIELRIINGGKTDSGDNTVQDEPLSSKYSELTKKISETIDRIEARLEKNMRSLDENLEIMAHNSRIIQKRANLRRLREHGALNLNYRQRTLELMAEDIGLKAILDGRKYVDKEGSVYDKDEITSGNIYAGYIDGLRYARNDGQFRASETDARIAIDLLNKNDFDTFRKIYGESISSDKPENNVNKAHIKCLEFLGIYARHDSSDLLYYIGYIIGKEKKIKSISDRDS